ncbi:OmpA family protein [Lentzea sp. NPDC034063]|uniref:OmpA family protein n=1 Tax=unclassified Lentzea TaxID=2643253 RepID=UPI0033CEA2EF
MNDDLDEMLKARHEVFVADLAAVLPPARLPLVVKRPVRSWVPQLDRAALVVATGVVLAVVVSLVVAFASPASVLPDARRIATQEPGYPWLTSPYVSEAVPPDAMTTERMTPAPEPSQITSSARTTTNGAEPPPWTELPPPPPPQPSLEDLTVIFMMDSAELSDVDLRALRRFVGRVRPSDRVIVIGYTARTSDTERALALSWRRAEAVRGVLLEAGLREGVITANGVGCTQAASEYDPRDDRAVVERV